MRGVNKLSYRKYCPYISNHCMYQCPMNFDITTDEQDHSYRIADDSYPENRYVEGQTVHIGDRDYFKMALGGQKNISNPISSRAGGALVITFASPITFNKEIKGVLFSIEDIETLSEISDSVTLGDYGRSYIVDSEGTIIAHKDRNLVKERTNPIREQQEGNYDKSVYNFFINIQESEKGGGHYLFDGEEVYAGYSRIGGTDWSFVISAPKSQIFKSLDRVYYFTIFMLALLLLVSSGAQIYTKYLWKSLEGEKAFSGIAIETANLIIISINANGVIYDFNKYAELKLGYEKSEIIGKIKLIDLVSEKHIDNYNKFMDFILKKENVDSYELPLTGKSKETLYIFWSTSIPYEYGKNIINMMGVDLTDKVELVKELADKHEELTALYTELQLSEDALKKQYDELINNQETIYNLAYFDSLTGLPNKAHLEKLFDSSIKDKETPSALLFFDLDNFKCINDALGHYIGDKLLIQVGERIKEMLRERHWGSRMGGDEFMILINGFSDINEVELYAEKLFMFIESVYHIENMPINISMSMGIAIYPEHGKDFNELMKSADTAMNKAKETGKRKYVLYNQEMNDEFVKNIVLENNLRKGLYNKEFLLYYQPLLDIKERKIRGFEALLRWNSPECGIVPAAEFIELTEATGLILPLGKWVLNEACSFIKFLKVTGYSHLKVAVNISVLQLIQDDFVDMVMNIINKYSIDPACLELEITETILMEFFENNLEKIKKLNDFGIGISLDDFGTGYSSLTYLRELPIRILKIDKSFIDDISCLKDKESIAGSIISFVHEINLQTVAEGVESKEQLDYLSGHNCDIVQGYYISKPLPMGKAVEFLFESG
jgi:diguanylate cyclase (GGDEF)-like protein/PAS domain S-box-containing protein